MEIVLVEDFKLSLNVKKMYLNITDTYSALDGTPMANIALDILSDERFEDVESQILDEEGNAVGVEMTETKVPLSSPYHLERVVQVPGIPFALVNAVVNASADVTLLPGINYMIDQAGFNQLFTGSLAGLKLEIAEVKL